MRCHERHAISDRDQVLDLRQQSPGGNPRPAVEQAQRAARPSSPSRWSPTGQGQRHHSVRPLAAGQGSKTYRKEYPTAGFNAFVTRTVTDPTGAVLHYDNSPRTTPRWTASCRSPERPSRPTPQRPLRVRPRRRLRRRPRRRPRTHPRTHPHPRPSCPWRSCPCWQPWPARRSAGASRAARQSPRTRESRRQQRRLFHFAGGSPRVTAPGAAARSPAAGARSSQLREETEARPRGPPGTARRREITENCGPARAATAAASASPRRGPLVTTSVWIDITRPRSVIRAFRTGRWRLGERR